MIVSKPLATPMGSGVSSPSRIMRGVPLSGRADFSSLIMPARGDANGIPLEKRGQALLDEHMANAEFQKLLASQAAIPQNLPPQALAGQAMLTQAAGRIPPSRTTEEAGELLRNLNAGPRPDLNLLRNMPVRPDGLEGAETAIRVRSHRQRSSPEAEPRPEKAAPLLETDLNEASGRLSARFESGAEGIAAIGYDKMGGTSYGSYQLSSRAGTMTDFINYLRQEEPDWAKRLSAAGAADTGSKAGAMPKVWQELATENPGRFAALQENFIRRSHMRPAMEAIAEKTGLHVEDMPAALKEVVFSTAVQHGPSGAADIISRAAAPLKAPLAETADVIAQSGEALIRRIYDLRSDQFGSSTAKVRTAVKNRLREEMNVAIGMLHKENLG